MLSIELVSHVKTNVKTEPAPLISTVAMPVKHDSASVLILPYREREMTHNEHLFCSFNLKVATMQLIYKGYTAKPRVITPCLSDVRPSFAIAVIASNETLHTRETCNVFNNAFCLTGKHKVTKTVHSITRLHSAVPNICNPLCMVFL